MRIDLTRKTALVTGSSPDHAEPGGQVGQLELLPMRPKKSCKIRRRYLGREVDLYDVIVGLVRRRLDCGVGHGQPHVADMPFGQQQRASRLDPITPTPPALSDSRCWAVVMVAVEQLILSIVDVERFPAKTFFTVTLLYLAAIAGAVPVWAAIGLPRSRCSRRSTRQPASLHPPHWASRRSLLGGFG
jgi:hypothetical protein